MFIWTKNFWENDEFQLEELSKDQDLNLMSKFQVFYAHDFRKFCVDYFHDFFPLFSDTDVEKLKKLSRHHSGVEPSVRSRHSSGDPTDDDDDDDLILGVFASQEERDK